MWTIVHCQIEKYYSMKSEWFDRRRSATATDSSGLPHPESTISIVVIRDGTLHDAVPVLHDQVIRANDIDHECV
jgi:hypothetical protein